QSTTDANAIVSTLVTGLGLQPTAHSVVLAQQLGGRSLYVLDDLYQALVKDRRGGQALVRALYDHSSPACFLLTSRELVGIPGTEHSSSLASLLPPHDPNLFRRLAAPSNYTGRGGDEKRLTSLLHCLGGYPPALSLAAHLPHDSSLEYVPKQWQDRR